MKLGFPPQTHCEASEADFEAARLARPNGVSSGFRGESATSVVRLILSIIKLWLASADRQIYEGNGAAFS